MILIRAAVVTLALGVAARAAPATPLYFPDSAGPWSTVAPASVGWSEADLAAALDFAGERQSSAVVVLHRGRLLAERTWPVSAALGRAEHGGAIEDVASVQKSVVALLVGIARQRGLIELDDPAGRWLGDSWSRAQPEEERRITLRHLLTMTSGLDDTLATETAPGTKWRYNTPAYAKLISVLERAARLDLPALSAAWLTGPLGMGDSQWRLRPREGRAAVASPWGFQTTARDMARFGLLVLAGGEWRDGTAVVESRFLAEALRPSQQLNPRYGFLWWLNAPPAAGSALPDAILRQFVTEAPSDMVSAQGAEDRRIYIVPSFGLVVTRTGAAAGRDFDREFWRRLRPAAPTGR